MAVDFAPTGEQATIVETVRRFLEREVHPLEPEFLRREREGSPGLEEARPESRARARRSGLGGLGTPEEYGGAGPDPVTRSLVHTEVGRTYAPFAPGAEADDILYRATPARQEECLFPHPGGDKTIMLHHDRARPRCTRRRRDGFLVDRTDGWTSSPIDTMGGTRPASLLFDGVRVPGTRVPGEVGQGFRLAMEWIDRGRFVLASYALGIAHRALEMGTDGMRRLIISRDLLRGRTRVGAHLP
ncbi:acyl-CoA dehydrogenase family protein [Nocardiopsis sp. ATB16-24]|uniref:acyl-CoA dehydrogenase family protein n=1 Tax=Nocardiopsis sp. ATB16-24 TaxID=3019555 RepID=UPI0025536C10|nr:acyl-CoA dehydrogenase family protein [Nocardiopsis sp. ATB16-24]